MKSKQVATLTAVLLFLGSCAEPVSVEDVVSFLQSGSSDATEIESHGLISEFKDNPALSAFRRERYRKVVRRVNQKTVYGAILSNDGTLCERSVWFATDDLSLLNLTQIRTSMKSELGEVKNFTFVNASEFLSDRVYIEYRVDSRDSAFFLTYSPNDEVFSGRHAIGLRYVRDTSSKECLANVHHIVNRLRESPNSPIVKAPIPAEVLIELRRAQWLPPQ